MAANITGNRKWEDHCWQRHAGSGLAQELRKRCLLTELCFLRDNWPKHILPLSLTRIHQDKENPHVLHLFKKEKEKKGGAILFRLQRIYRVIMFRMDYLWSYLVTVPQNLNVGMIFRTMMLKVSDGVATVFGAHGRFLQEEEAAVLLNSLKR